MRLVNHSGLWTTGPCAEPAAVVALLEVGGAVLSWVVDSADAPVITFTDHLRADWLWRVVGEPGHIAVVDALHQPGTADPIELPTVTLQPGPADTLRRLAFGHWLRRWWPASERDGIAALDRCVLDAELALLTVAAEDYFTDDTLDSDATALLAPHVDELNFLSALGDSRISALTQRCQELAEEIGLAWPEVADAQPIRRQDDYALAAGGGDAQWSTLAPIATGVSTVNWSAVPPGVFDTAEENVDWAVIATGSAVNCQVQAAVTGPGQPSGIAAAMRCGDFSGVGVLDARGRATVPLLDAGGEALPESQAWSVRWSPAEVTVGVAGATEPRHVRDRVRAFARRRLAEPPADAFLAEVLAAESDY